ncbi:YcaO-like family protein [Pelagibius sp.]|uniref:YcaO-like family protein n=1 Tax=Pelagibius sp. TaxID=1931238 RepID=UPI00262F6F68|nr:YcaO-like family protein [Pelagibius sp.]
MKSWKRGSHRTLGPGETVASIRPLCRDFGITFVDDVTHWDRIGIPVVMVVRPEGRMFGVAQGKGLDIDAAIASGLMEAIESWHAERVVLTRTVASVSQLYGAQPMLDVERLPLQRLGRLHDDLPIPWVEGIDLMNDGAPVLVPYALVHTDYCLPTQPGHGCFCNSSNGLASGNSFEEALVHGICEVIERDALAIWHGKSAAAKSGSRIDLATIDDPDCLDLLDRFAAADMAVGVWDATSDIGVAVFHVEIIERGGRLPLFFPVPIAGDGCHPDRAVALVRALTEAAQSRLTCLVGSRDDLDDPDAKLDEDRVRRARRRIAECGKQAGCFQSVPHADAALFTEDVAWLLERFRMAGIDQVAAVDLSRPEFPQIAVVRVVVPGLETVVYHPKRVPGPRAINARQTRILPIAEAMA